MECGLFSLLQVPFLLSVTVTIGSSPSFFHVPNLVHADLTFIVRKKRVREAGSKASIFCHSSLQRVLLDVVLFTKEK